MAAKGKSSGKFDVGDPAKQVETYLSEFKKYRLGDSGLSFHQIRTLTPVFAFDYLSMNSGQLCFNRDGLEAKDYVGLLNGLKNISKVPYNELHNTRAYRFHKIDFNDERVSITRKQFKEIIAPREDVIADDALPNLWQFDLQYVGAARAAGFIYKGVFYLVWYDRDHEIYPSKD